MFESVQAVLIDLDGVLYIEGDPIPGASDALQRLRSRPLALRFMTNTTSHSLAATRGKLEALGFAVAPGELVTPAALAVQHCRQWGYRRVALVMNDEVKQDFAELEEVTGDEGAQAVIVGDLGSDFGYAVLNRAFRQVMAGAELIALQKNRYWMQAGGLALDVGAFVAAIEYASRVESYVVGKPARSFFEEALRDLGVPATAALMIGDDVESDVGGALAAGLGAVLVRTGKYREEQATSSGIRPTFVIDSIADLPRLFES
jgi:HAD superfamily hydrolase (TIGR01458 family)